MKRPPGGKKSLLLLLVLLFVNGRLVEFSNGGIYFGEGGVVIGLRYFVDR